MRQVVLDTETTGLEASAGHRIIEIGCVELVNRRPTKRNFHRYVNPERTVDAGALEVHGIDDEFLSTQPRFREVAEEFLDFVRDAELVIHNADFDVEFINHELRRLDATSEIRDCCQVLDTLALARRMHPGQRNSLDALAKRYGVDNSKRELHGALLDAQILADIYLAMTGGQVSLLLDGGEEHEAAEARTAGRIDRDGLELPVLAATAEEEAAHAAFLERIRAKAGGQTLWERMLGAAESGPVAGREAAPAEAAHVSQAAHVGEAAPADAARAAQARAASPAGAAREREAPPPVSTSRSASRTAESADAAELADPGDGGLTPLPA